MPVSLKIEHRIHNVLHDFGTRNGTVFVDMADNKGRYLIRFCHIQEACRAFLDLADRAGGRRHIRAAHRLDGVDHYKIRLHLFNQPAGQVMLLRFDDYARMLNGNDHVAGFVLNPFTDNLRFNSDMVASLLKQRNAMLEKIKQTAAQQAAQRNAQIKPGDKVTIVEPSVYPDELVNPLCAELEKYPMVGAAYLQIMVINGATKSYLLVLDAPKDDALFKAAGDAARPFLVSNEKKMNLNITISTSPLGQQGMRGSEPFYIKGQGRVDNLGDDED